MSKQTDIQKLIKDCGGRQTFADLTGIAVRTTYDWESGNKEPSETNCALYRDACKWRMGAEG